MDFLKIGTGCDQTRRECVFYIVFGSLGVGLSILGVGFVILFLLILAAWGLAHFERLLANAMLGADVPPVPPTATEEGGWPWVKSVMGNPVTWKGLLFQILKFPLGLGSWIVTIVVLAIVFAFIFAPAALPFGGTIQIDPWWVVDTQREAWIATAIGASVTTSPDSSVAAAVITCASAPISTRMSGGGSNRRMVRQSTTIEPETSFAESATRTTPGRRQAT